MKKKALILGVTLLSLCFGGCQKKVAPTEINIIGPSYVGKDKTANYKVEIKPEEGACSDVTWSITSGSEYATIDQNGVLTGISEGSVKIKATSTVDANIYSEKDILIKKYMSKGEFLNLYKTFYSNFQNRKDEYFKTHTEETTFEIACTAGDFDMVENYTDISNMKFIYDKSTDVCQLTCQYTGKTFQGAPYVLPSDKLSTLIDNKSAYSDMLFEYQEQNKSLVMYTVLSIGSGYQLEAICYGTNGLIQSYLLFITSDEAEVMTFLNPVESKL